MAGVENWAVAMEAASIVRAEYDRVRAERAELEAERYEVRCATCGDVRVTGDWWQTWVLSARNVHRQLRPDCPWPDLQQLDTWCIQPDRPFQTGGRCDCD